MASVDAALAEQVSSWGALSMKKTEQAIDALVDKFDPGALRRSRTASWAREVVIGSPTDEAGFTSLWGRLYAPDAAALDRRLEAMARAACAEDSRTLAERRADALGALAAGGDRLGCECAGANCSAGQRDRAPSTVRKQKSAIQRLQVPEQGHQPAQTMPADDHSKDRNHWGVPVGGLGRPRAHKKPKCRWSRLAERGHRELLVALNLRRGRHLRRAERASATIPATRTVVLQLEHHQRRKAIRDFETAARRSLS